jgi:hypothetical protein
VSKRRRPPIYPGKAKGVEFMESGLLISHFPLDGGRLVDRPLGETRTGHAPRKGRPPSARKNVG